MSPLRASCLLSCLTAGLIVPGLCSGRGGDDAGWRRVSGHVCDPRGFPVAGARLCLRLGTPDQPGARLQWHSTDAFGWFQMSTAADRRTCIEVAADGFVATVVAAAAGGVVVVVPQVAIEGRVVDVDGRPRGRVRLQVTDVADPAVQRVAWSEADGSFAVEVPAGRQFVVRPADFEGTRVDVAPIGASTTVEVRLSR
jgi:hypothetical protein